MDRHRPCWMPFILPKFINSWETNVFIDHLSLLFLLGAKTISFKSALVQRGPYVAWDWNLPWRETQQITFCCSKS
jgi:hypothetical protein